MAKSRSVGLPPTERRSSIEVFDIIETSEDATQQSL